MTRLIVIRHGFSIANMNHVFAGHSDFPLSEIGKRQACAAADYLLAHEKIDAVYASDLLRATETARPTAERFSLPIIPEKGLREIFAGEWESLPFTEIKERYVKDYACWVNDLPHSRCTGGESVAELFDRVNRTLLRIARENEGKTVLLATHWTPVLSMVCYAMGQGVEHMTDYPAPPNASIQVLRYDNGSLSPEALNIISHLGDMLTDC